MSPQFFWRLPRAGGLSAACSARLTATVPVSPRREHLNLVGGDAHVLGQARFAQLHHRLHEPVGRAAAQEEEVPLIALEVRRVPLVHGVGVADDGRLLRLTEDLRQGN